MRQWRCLTLADVSGVITGGPGVGRGRPRSVCGPRADHAAPVPRQSGRRVNSAGRQCHPPVGAG